MKLVQMKEILGKAGYGKIIDTSDNLYVINSREKAYSSWIASPSGNNTDVIVGVSYLGNLNRNLYNKDDGLGFRPLVCLKSNVQLEKNSDGTYTIK